MAQLCRWTKIHTKQWFVWVRRLFNVCVRVFRAPNATILFVYIAAKIKMSFVRKDDFVFAKIGKRIVAIFPRLCLCCNIASVYTTIFFLHTYIIGHYNPSVRIIDLVSHTTYVKCVNFIHKWRDLQFKVDSERQIFWETFSWQFYLLSEFFPEICWEEIAEEILFVFRFGVWPGTRTLAFRLIGQHTTY